jgi:hypothetical protein
MMTCDLWRILSAHVATAAALNAARDGATAMEAQTIEVLKARFLAKVDQTGDCWILTELPTGSFTATSQPGIWFCTLATPAVA